MRAGDESIEGDRGRRLPVADSATPSSSVSLNTSAGVRLGAIFAEILDQGKGSGFFPMGVPGFQVFADLTEVLKGESVGRCELTVGAVDSSTERGIGLRLS